MIIIGLDISLNSPGWCRIDTENGARTFDTMDFSDRLDMRRIWDAAHDMIELCRNADMVVMEGLSMGLPTGPTGRSFVPQGRYDLVGLTYVVRLWLWKKEKKSLLVSPTALKKFTTADFRAKKDMMIREVFRRWGAEVGDDNQADAVALAEVGRAYHIRPVDLPVFQKEVLKKVQVLGDPPKPKKPKAKRAAVVDAA